MPNSKPRTLAVGDCPTAEIPEELIMSNILLKITNGACMARCRCVCKSWRHLFSGPSLIRRKLVQPPDSDDDQIIITCSDHNSRSDDIYRRYSPDTTEPLFPNYFATLHDDLGHDVKYARVAGCCDGLFCLKLFPTGHPITHRLSLWNPATSETKVLPPPSLHPCRTSMQVGFGFDQETNDYKVFRQLDDDDNLYRTEVYSLRKDSWRILEGYSPKLITCDRQIPTCHKGKLYWRELEFIHRKGLLFHSIDISSEALESFEVSFPVAADHPRICRFYGCLFGGESMIALLWFYDPDSRIISCEIWMLLRCWVSESWVRLFAFRDPIGMFISRPIGISKNLRCFFYGEVMNSSKRVVYVFDLESGKLNDFEIDKQCPRPRQVINYTPSQISLKDYYC